MVGSYQNITSVRNKYVLFKLLKIWEYLLLQQYLVKTDNYNDLGPQSLYL